MTKLVSLLAGVVFLVGSVWVAAGAPDYRVPKTFKVEAQSVVLRLDPSVDDYSGSTTLSVNVKQSIDALVLHWVDLDIKSISLSSPGAKARRLEFKQGEYAMWHLSDGAAIAPGKYTLEIAFHGEYSRDALGLYKTEFNGKPYLFTQFETDLARRAFPLVDEPDTKIPWTMTIAAPEGLQVAANTIENATTSKDGWTTHVFNSTPKMSGYLVAFTVGEFDVTPIPGMHVPSVIYSPVGTGKDVGFAANRTAEILTALETYFGRKLPYEKVDFVAVPDFAFGAMENVGLVTYRTELLLRGDDAKAGQALSTVNVIAHELAHMWYGDLVAMAWWDDLWLNEAFATWMAQKVVADLYPQYNSRLNLPQQGALPADGLAASRPITKVVKTQQDVLDGLGLNYSKGHSILNMLEQAMGEDAFQRGIRAYMKKHEWGNTVAADLWAALEAEADFSVGKVAQTFLNNPGYPLLTFEGGKVTQQRYRAPGSTVSEAEWIVPVAMRYSVKAQVKDQVFTLDAKTQSVSDIANANWIFPGMDGNGYYVWYTGPARYNALINDLQELNDREKAALLVNTDQLLSADVVGMETQLRLLGAVVQQDNMQLARQALEGIREIAAMYTGTDLEKPLGDYINTVMAPWYERLGSVAVAGEEDAAIPMRARVMRTLAQYGRDESVIQTMTEMAGVYLASPAKVEANLGHESLRIAAMYSESPELADKYIAIYQSTDNATLRSQVTQSFYFTDRASVDRVFDAMLAGVFQSGDLQRVLSGLFYANTDQAYLYERLNRNFDQIVKALPQTVRGALPQIAGAHCNESNLGLLGKLYSEQGELYKRSLEKSQEAARNCINTAMRGEASVSALLRK